jgi:hypothetical protein
MISKKAIEDEATKDQTEAIPQDQADKDEGYLDHSLELSNKVCTLSFVPFS